MLTVLGVIRLRVSATAVLAAALLLASVFVAVPALAQPDHGAREARGRPLLQLAAADDLLLAPAPAAKPSSDAAPSSGDDLLLAPAPDGKPAAASKDDLLLAPSPGGKQAPATAAPAVPPAPAATVAAPSAFDEHQKLFAENRFPSADVCATCHPRQYDEWSASQHAYSQLSPVFVTMQAAINNLTSGTNGDFCTRCHTPVGMNLDESVYLSNFDRHPTAREGVTCITCHRVAHNYGKISGRVAIAEGDLFAPVYGPTGNAELKRVLGDPEQYHVTADRNASGRGIHGDVKRFFPLVTPGFCGTCHDVTLVNGFRLEEAFAEFHQAPASAAGVTCQDCHMGKVQGVAAGYDEGPAAVVGGVPTRTRKITSHFFAGPDHSILHPGLFPHSVEAASFKTLREWVLFDDKAGWGTDAFENKVPKGYSFPDAWRSIDDRYDGRKIVEKQKQRLAAADRRRLEVLRNGLGLGEIKVDRSGDGLEFSIAVRNLIDGHSVPTGFDADRLMFLDVVVTDPAGKVVYLSGDRDPNGDVRDAHSAYVRDGDLPLDSDLFSLQSKFLVRLLRGGEREQVLPINTSAGVQPFVRPEVLPTTIYGRPRGARKHKQTIDPLSLRVAKYHVPKANLTGPGPYEISVRLLSQMVPVNLILEIQQVGFDYGMTPRQVGDAVVAGTLTIAERNLTVDLSQARPVPAKR